ncbi:fatty acid desaturase, partial [Priestia megaterium]|nr:fatty acid desaturase [Priestia megaterium]
PLQKATIITLSTSLKSLRFRLLDQKNKRFVSFKEIKHLLDNKKSRVNLNNKRPTLDKN